MTVTTTHRVEFEPSLEDVLERRRARKLPVARNLSRVDRTIRRWALAVMILILGSLSLGTLSGIYLTIFFSTSFWLAAAVFGSLLVGCLWVLHGSKLIRKEFETDPRYRGPTILEADERGIRLATNLVTITLDWR